MVNVTAAELKPLVELRSCCWVCLQRVVKLRGGASLGLRLDMALAARGSCSSVGGRTVMI